MEENEILDPLNEMHLYVLHCVFLPRINRSCAEFCQQWNNHPLSTEKSRTPLQVWSEGLYLNWNSEIHNTCDLVDDDLTFFGVDDDGPIPDLQTDNDVQIPDCTAELSPEMNQHL